MYPELVVSRADVTSLLYPDLLYAVCCGVNLLYVIYMQCALSVKGTSSDVVLSTYMQYAFAVKESSSQYMPLK